ncbi:MAG: restriction endonuclease subunit S [Flavobacteriales bacterium]
MAKREVVIAATLSAKSKGAVRPGYKLTKLGWLPEEWGVGKLGAHIALVSGFHLNKGEYSFGGNGMAYFTGPTDVVQHEDLVQKRTLLRQAIAPQHSTLITVKGSGAGTIFYQKMLEVSMGRQLMAAVAKDLDDLFLYYLLNSKAEQIEVLSRGNMIPGVSRGDILTLFVASPTLPEQRRIAAILGTWDKAITTLGALIAAKQRRKQGLMQELLSGKRRLNGHTGAWKRMKLADLGTFSKGKGITKNDLRESGVPCVTYGELYTVHHVLIKKFYSFIDPSTAEASQPIYKGDVLFAGSGETAEEIGKAAVYLGDGPACAGGDVIILRPKGIDPLYLSFALSSATADAQRKKLGQGHSVVHIYPSQLAHMELPIAPAAEQTLITRLLEAMDNEITLLEDQLTHITTQKRGLMQQLLTGAVRVKTIAHHAG